MVRELPGELGGLIGRDREVSRVDAFCRNAGTYGAVLVIEGDPGVGKSRLLQTAVDRAVAAGDRVLQMCGAQWQGEIGYGGLHQLLYPHRDHFEILEPRHRDALRVCLGLASGRPPSRSGVAAATVAFVRGLASETPVLVIADDVHWVDRATADVLGAVARHVLGAPIGLLVAVRSHTPSPFDHITLPHLHVAPLDRPDAARLLALRDDTIPEATRDRLLDRANGNPLAVLELPLDSDGRVAEAGPLPARLQSMFAPRIQRLSVRTRELLLLAALEGSGHLEVLLTAGAGRFGESEVAELVQHGLVLLDMGSQTLRLAHPLIGSTVVGLATPRELRSANRMLGLAGKGIENRARHLAAAAIGPDETTALLLERSARQLVLRGDAVGAVRMLLRAAELSPRPSDRARRLAQAAFLGADRTGDLHRVAGLLADAGRDGTRVGDSLEAAMAAAYLLLNGDGDIETAHRLLVAALSASRRDHVDVHTRVDAVFTLLWICFFGGRSELRAPLAAELARLGPAAPSTLRLCAVTFAAPLLTTPEDRAELLTQISTLDRDPDPAHSALLGRAAFYLDELAACREALSTVIAEDNAADALTAAIDAWILLAFHAFLDGRWNDALNYSSQGVEVSQERGYELLAWPGRYCQALVAAATGDSGKASRLSDDMLRWAQPRGVRPVVAYAHHVEALSALGRRDFGTAYRHAAAVQSPGPLDEAFPHGLWLLLDFIEAATHSGHEDEAQTVVDAMVAVDVARLSSRYALIVGASKALTAGALKSHDEAIALFESALQTPDIDRWPFEVARVQLLYGEQLRRARQHTRARSQLASAADAFDLLGAAPWASRAESELRATVGRRVPPDASHASLTHRELEVATMAATGLTNGQIADQLRLSPRTVATHLSRALSKLGLSSRAALASAILDGARRTDR